MFSVLQILIGEGLLPVGWLCALTIVSVVQCKMSMVCFTYEGRLGHLFASSLSVVT